MASALRDNAFFQKLEAEHRRWLSAFDPPQYLCNWERLLNSDEEAAFAEARVRALLEGYGVGVEPNEDLTGARQQPDFRCCRGVGEFYVEVTTIRIDSATAKTGIPTQGSRECTTFRPLNEAIFSKCLRKAAQCGDLDAPALVAIGTFHGFAAMISFDRISLNDLLTGETKLECLVDKSTGNQVGQPYQITELHSAAFLRPDETQEVGYARSSISGLLLCGLGSEPPSVRGVLHPNPVRPFDPAILPEVEFGQVDIDQASRQLRVSWPARDHE